jgi:hypothetical protein
MFEQIPPELKDSFVGSVGVMAAAWIGRLVWHVQQVQLKRRNFWSIHLLWELIVALMMGLVADGVCTYFELTGKPATAAIVFVAYLGPRTVETIIVRVAEKATK